MNKLLTTLLVGTFTLTLGTTVFAADAAKTAEPVKAEASKVAEPVKAEEAKSSEPGKTDKKITKKNHGKHAKKAAETNPAETAPASEAPAVK